MTKKDGLKFIKRAIKNGDCMIFVSHDGTGTQTWSRNDENSTIDIVMVQKLMKNVFDRYEREFGNDQSKVAYDKLFKNLELGTDKYLKAVFPVEYKREFES